MKVRRLKGRFYRKAGGPRQIGHRCKAYFAGCIVCESYRFLDERGRFPSFDEAAARSDEVLGNRPPAREVVLPLSELAG